MYILDYGSVRINGVTGLLQVYTSGWRYMCDDYWTMDDTYTVCRQLGYRRASSYLTGQYNSNDQSRINNVRCSGNKLHLNECDYTTNDYCRRNEKVKVLCDASKLLY